MNDADGVAARSTCHPPHLGELIRESMDEVGWNVTETAALLGCERGTLSRVLTGRRAFRRTWRSRWRVSAGARPITGCGCRRAMSLRGHDGHGNGAGTEGSAIQLPGNA